MGVPERERERDKISGFLALPFPTTPLSIPTSSFDKHSTK